MAYVLPLEVSPLYSATSTGIYTNQLTNNVTSSLVNFFVSNDDLAKGVFYCVRSLLPVYTRYKSIYGWYCLTIDDEANTLKNCSASWVESICLPDSSITPAATSIGGVIKTARANITTLQTNVASNTSSINSLSTTVGTNVSDITSLKTTVGTHTSQITAIMSSLTSILSRLSVLETGELNAGLITGSSVPYTTISGVQPNSQILANKTAISTLNTNVASIKAVVNSNVTTNNSNVSTYNAENLNDITQGSSKTNKFVVQSSITQF